MSAPEEGKAEYFIGCYGKGFQPDDFGGLKRSTEEFEQWAGAHESLENLLSEAEDWIDKLT